MEIFGKAAWKTLPTEVGKGGEAWASARAHLLLVLLAASLSSGAGEEQHRERQSTFLQSLHCISNYKHFRRGYCVIFVRHPHGVFLQSLTAVLQKLLILPIQSNCCLCLKWEMEKCCAFHQWNWLAAMNIWKNPRFIFRLIAVLFCILNLINRSWLKCSWKCTLAI